jgi:ferredoxin
VAVDQRGAAIDDLSIGLVNLLQFNLCRIDGQELLVRIRIVDELCQGHALCGAWAWNDISHRDEDGHAFVLRDEVDPKDEESVRRAVQACPEKAIQIVESC